MARKVVVPKIRIVDEIVKIKRSFWRRFAKELKEHIFDDMVRGTAQVYKNARARVYSPDYAKYKANFMRRFTDGRKLMKYAGVPVINNDTRQVNMLLTGRTIKRLKLTKIDDKGIEMEYHPDDYNKIIGNEQLGRSIRELSPKNKKWAKEQISNEIGISIKRLNSKIIRIK